MLSLEGRHVGFFRLGHGAVVDLSTALSESLFGAARVTGELPDRLTTRWRFPWKKKKKKEKLTKFSNSPASQMWWHQSSLAGKGAEGQVQADRE